MWGACCRCCCCVCDAQGKPAQAKGQDRLGGRSRIKVEEDNPYLYLSEVCVCAICADYVAAIQCQAHAACCPMPCTETETELKGVEVAASRRKVQSTAGRLAWLPCGCTPSPLPHVHACVCRRIELEGTAEGEGQAVTLSDL